MAGCITPSQPKPPGHSNLSPPEEVNVWGIVRAAVFHPDGLDMYTFTYPCNNVSELKIKLLTLNPSLADGSMSVRRKKMGHAVASE